MKRKIHRSVTAILMAVMCFLGLIFPSLAQAAETRTFKTIGWNVRLIVSGESPIDILYPYYSSWPMAKVSQQPSDTSKSSEMQNAYLKDGTSYLYVENWEYYLNENNYQLTRYSMPLVTPITKDALATPSEQYYFDQGTIPSLESVIIQQYGKDSAKHKAFKRLLTKGGRIEMHSIDTICYSKVPQGSINSGVTFETPKDTSYNWDPYGKYNGFVVDSYYGDNDNVIGYNKNDPINTVGIADLLIYHLKEYRGITGPNFSQFTLNSMKVTHPLWGLFPAQPHVDIQAHLTYQTPDGAVLHTETRDLATLFPDQSQAVSIAFPAAFEDSAFVGWERTYLGASSSGTSVTDTLTVTNHADGRDEDVYYTVTYEREPEYDLTIDSVNIENWYADRDVVVTAVIRSKTSDSIPATDVRMRLGDLELRETICVPGNGTNLAVFRFRTPSDPGEYPIEFIVDPDNVIPETNETNNEYSETAHIFAVPASSLVDPDDPAMQKAYQEDGIVPPAPATGAATHSWTETRYEDGQYITKHYWARLENQFFLSPDTRVSLTNLLESGFGVNLSCKTILTTNYDRVDKLIGPQMVWVTYPESAYGTGQWGNVRSSLEVKEGTPGEKIVTWQNPINPYSILGTRLHYIPLWYPDGAYLASAQAFYAWTPLGQLHSIQTGTVEVYGDMYDRIHVVRR